MLWMVTAGLARTRRTIRPAVRSSISAFHSSAAPFPAAVPVSPAPKAAAEPASPMAPSSSGQRPGSGEVRSASSSTAAKRPIWRSTVSVLPLNAESR